MIVRARLDKLIAFLLAVCIVVCLGLAKLFGVDIAWWWVLAPLWLPPIAIFAVLSMFVCVGLCFGFVGVKYEAKEYEGP